MLPCTIIFVYFAFFFLVLTLSINFDQAHTQQAHNKMDNLGDRLRQLTSIAQRFGGRGGADKFKQSAGNASNGIVALLALAGLGFGI